MQHLISYSVYQDQSVFGRDPCSYLKGLNCDGVEMLTSYEPADPSMAAYTRTVHLPYSTDWLSAWQGRPFEMDDTEARYYMYGKTPEEIVDNISLAIRCAEPLKPEHGVMHLSNVDFGELIMRRYTRSSEEVIREFCKVMNAVAEGFPGGEPPIRIAFENLWWPGLRLVDDSDFRLMANLLEFDNWSICLDTGHLMNSLPGIRSQQDGIEALEKIFAGYCDELIEKVRAVHFHFSASGDYRATFEEVPMTGPVIEHVTKAYPHVCRLDQHRPFSDPACQRLLEILQPETVIHELPGSDNGMVADFIQQRSLLKI